MKSIATRSMLLFGILTSIQTATYAAPPTFQQAVADYSAGKYAQASSELEWYKQAYPNNAMVHYYLALCKQAMGQLEGAKAEYLWVTQNGDAKLKGMAQSGFDQLSKVRSASSSASSAPTASPTQTSAPVVANAKVKKIIEFYADW